MAAGPRPQYIRLNITEMKKNFDSKMACFNHRLNKWGNVFKKPVFTFKTRDKYDESLEVMPVGKYFDYLLDIHVIHTQHGGIEKMMKAIREEGLWMPFEAVYVFHKYCSKCSSLRIREFRRDTVRSQMNKVLSSSGPNYRVRGFVELIDMRKKPDGQYKYILHYRDLSTYFSWLRPLKTPTATEAANELFQIFMTYGAPAVLHTPVKQTFAEATIKHLKILMPEIMILVGNPRASSNKKENIPNLVQKWMENSKNDHWSMGIYYVQSDMNRTQSKDMSPYEAMFHRIQGTGLIKRFSNKASKNLLKKLENEEDLSLPSVETYVLAAGEELSETSLNNNDDIWNDWCAVCGNNFADSLCDVCGVAMHLICNAAMQRLCDCCKTLIPNHEHTSLQNDNSGDKQLSVNTSVTVALYDDINKTDNQLVSVNKLDAEILKTSVEPAKAPESPAHSADVVATEGGIDNVASTNTQPNKLINLADDELELKVGRIIGKYSKRKKSTSTKVKDNVTQPDNGQAKDVAADVKQELDLEVVDE